MSTSRVQKAFEAELAKYATIKGVPIAWDNTTFNPDGLKPFYFVPSILPIDAGFTSLQRGMRVWEGIFQVLLVAQPGGGSQAHRQAADELAEHMAAVGMPDGSAGVRGLPADDSVYVSGNTSVGVAYDGQNGYTIPVSVPYRLDV